ncbi:MAG: hypothetical protein M0R32_02685 [Candidatus Cloacimonetes bacterium]|nr:hypothetical protein [Candidatus Cloacimonadota bacterium]
MTRELIIENAFLFEAPIKAVWSDFHQKIMVLGKNIAYTFNPDTFKVVPFQETEGYSFKDIAVAKNGEVALLLQYDSSCFGEIKILSPNLFSIEKKLNTSEDILKYAKFTNDNNLIVISELSEQPDEENIDSKVYFIDSKKTLSEGLISTVGEIIGIDISPENLSLAISQGGDVVLLPSEISEFEADNSSESLNSDESDEESSKSSMEIIRFETKILGNIGTGVKSFSIGLKSVETSDTTQMKVRVFVGSRPWQNDRWDSEEIETKKTSILYGGGDNLIPGRNYWVHVSVWHQDSGWSRPQIRKFTMPYRHYEDESSSESSSSSTSTEILTTSSSQSSSSSKSSSSESSSSLSSKSSSSESSSSESSSSLSSDSSSSSSMSSESSSSSSQDWHFRLLDGGLGGTGSLANLYYPDANSQNSNNGAIYVFPYTETANPALYPPSYIYVGVRIYGDLAKTELITQGSTGPFAPQAGSVIKTILLSPPGGGTGSITATLVNGAIDVTGIGSWY